MRTDPIPEDVVSVSDSKLLDSRYQHARKKIGRVGCTHETAGSDAEDYVEKEHKLAGPARERAPVVFDNEPGIAR